MRTMISGAIASALAVALACACAIASDPIAPLFAACAALIPLAWVFHAPKPATVRARARHGSSSERTPLPGLILVPRDRWAVPAVSSSPEAIARVESPRAEP